MSQPAATATAPPAAATPWHYPLLAAPLLALAWLPLPLLYGVAGLFYGLLAYVVRYRQRVVLDNLRHAFPEKAEADIRRLARRFYWHFAQLLVEILKLSTISPAALGRHIYTINPELLARALARQRPVLVLGSHLGNWEWILAREALEFPGQIAGVYKPLGNKFFDWFMRRLRTRTGAEAVPMAGTLRHLAQHRHAGREVSLLLDQAAGPTDRPYWTSFLNREAGFYTSAERLVPQFDAAVLYVGIRRERLGRHAVFFAELPSPAPLAGSPDAASFPITEAFVRQLESDIRAAPDQYLWTHRRWKYTRGTEDNGSNR